MTDSTKTLCPYTAAYAYVLLPAAQWSEKTGTIGRLYGHWHPQTRTGWIEKIRQMHPQPFIEIHPRDAAESGIQDNDWVEVRSRRSKSRFPAKVTEAIAPGTVFVPMHWGALWADQAEANALT